MTRKTHAFGRECVSSSWWGNLSEVGSTCLRAASTSSDPVHAIPCMKAGPLPFGFHCLSEDLQLPVVVTVCFGSCVLVLHAASCCCSIIILRHIVIAFYPSRSRFCSDSGTYYCAVWRVFEGNLVLKGLGLCYMCTHVLWKVYM